MAADRPSNRSWPSRSRRTCATLALVAMTAAAACVGNVGGESDRAPADPADQPTATGAAATYGPILVRRLSRHELKLALTALLDLDPSAELEAIPEDAQTPFDNDATTQAASTSLIEGVNLLARQLADRMLVERSGLEAMLPCAPSGPDDESCLRDFIAAFGRRALRRPLSTDEVNELAELGDFAVQDGDFLVAAALVVSALIQDLEFLYRVEIGEAVDGHPNLRRLTDHEMATRLSFLIWGTIPDGPLLDAADQGLLADAAGLKARAEAMFADPRARAQAARFHALWLDYDRIPLDPTLSASLAAESDALVGRILFEDARPYGELFTAEQTYVDATLASHYGLPAVATPGWVDYPDLDRRRGLLSHGSFLSVGGKFGDTSPVQRGQNIATRLLCRTVPAPPPDINADDPPDPPPGAVCKEDRYTMVDTPACASCHEQLDPLGFGLESYGPDGAWRDVEPDEPSCAISGDGHLPGFGDFRGAAELGALVADAEELSACMVQHLYQFAVGRAPLQSEQPLLDDVSARFHAARDWQGLLLELVASDAFRFLKLEDQP